jgi:hypothetical protein
MPSSATAAGDVVMSNFPAIAATDEAALAPNALESGTPGFIP